jgi:hypothetical protein
MRGLRAFGALAGLMALMGAGLAALPAGAAGTPPQADRGLVDARVCGPPAAGAARCHAHVLARPDGHGGVTPDVTTSPTGLSAAKVKAAYGFPTDATAGAGKTIAIVDAYNAPHIASDVATFSTAMQLPSCAVGSCLQVVNQTGGTSLPRTDSGWSLEIALDVEWAHAIAPAAKILLVEASSNSFTNLLAAEDYARAHADYVSNSWGANEFSGETSYDSHFVQSGVSFFVSAGDNGTPAEYPSSSPNVISVGGTTLHYSGGTLTGETGWTDGGGGCSTYESATAAQRAFGEYGQAACGGKRATPDVSLVADPASGVSVYTSDYGTAGWYVVGGTSASAPMWAGRSAVAGAVVSSASVYGTGIPFRDITTGNNGAPCLTGFDLCTGRGSWADNGAIGGGTTTTSSTTTSTTAPSSTTSTTAPSGSPTVSLAKAAKNKSVTPVTVTWSGFVAPVTVTRGSLTTSGQPGSGSLTDNWRGSGTVTYTVCGGDGFCAPPQSITI